MEQFGVEGTIKFSHDNLTEEEQKNLLTHVSNIADSDDDLYIVQTQHKDHTIVEIDSTNTAENVHLSLIRKLLALAMGKNDLTRF